MKRRPPAGGEPTDPGVFRSSTFRLALACGLLVWVLTLAGLWVSRRIEPTDSIDELQREAELAVHGVLAEIAVADREVREEAEDEDSEEDDAEDSEEEDEEDSEEEDGEDSEEEDEEDSEEEDGEDSGEEDEEDSGEEDEEDSGEEDGDSEEDGEGEEGSEASFDAAEWTHARWSTLLREADEMRPWLLEEDYCWQLLTPAGAWLDGNLSATAASEARSRWIDPDAPRPFIRVAGIEVELDPEEEREVLAVERREWDLLPDEERRHCLLQELQLGDGSRLRIGRPYEPFRLQPALFVSIVLVVLGLAAALGGSYVLARRTVRFVGDLRRARSRLEGEAFPRLRQPGDAGDFDRAAREINAILSALDSALGSLTHVTDNIAHDLRTPLTRLQGQLDILRRSGDPSEAMIGAVQEEADQLVATFNALLRIAQVESGHRKRGFRPFDLGLVVSDLGDLYAPAFAERGMPFACCVPGKPVASTGDPDLWMQALSNLLDNALKYNAEGGRVDLELRPGRQPQLTLRDCGPGIPERERERVFERFYRVERQRSQARGAGLGLSLVAAVCNLHGATIRLEGDDGLLVRITWPPSA